MKSVEGVAVIGNCQSREIGSCLDVMLGDIKVHVGFTRDINAGRTNLAGILEKSNVIFVQEKLVASVNKLLIESSDKKVITFPEIYYTGFHPDLVYGMSMGAILQSPIGSYNSALALYGWINGLSVSRTVGLFCKAVYEKVGYFDHYDASKRVLIKRAKKCGFKVDDLFDEWSSKGIFMHSVNHPYMHVIASVARSLVDLAGLPVVLRYPERIIPDNLIKNAVWPVYPEIGDYLGCPGEYMFKSSEGSRSSGESTKIYSLPEFVEASFDVYDRLPSRDIQCDRFQDERFQNLEAAVPYGGHSFGWAKGGGGNPYHGLPDYCFWRKSVARVPMEEVDPVVKVPFTLDPKTRIGTAGSCFAQHIAKALQRSGYCYYVTEPAPAEMSDSQAQERGYGLFSARYGNIYTARQLLQLFDMAYGDFAPIDRAWLRGDGRYIDPFRPQVEPQGYVTVEQVEMARQSHLAAVRHLFETVDVFVFTLGLTEAWRAVRDGAVFPLAPGVVAAGDADQTQYEFVNFGVDEVASDLALFLEKLRRVNPKVRVILTVSPVPLVATYEDRHVLVSTTYSKSVLRVAAEECSKPHDWVEYFPSYEIITGNFSRGSYFDEDLRSVKSDGVKHVMQLFLCHHFPSYPMNADDDALEREVNAGAGVVCDEEELDAGPV